jgi:hypothetical protein
MFDRISAGFRAASDCWAILRQDKKLLLLPLISGICCIVVLLSFVVPMVVARPQAIVALFNQNNPRAGAANLPWWFYALVFAFYFCNYFVIYFFNAALVYCALLHFKGIPVTVGDGLQAAARSLPHILAWSLLSATVGLILKAIENNREAGRFISGLLGTAWSIVTYFVVPVLIVEKVDPFTAIKRSTQILRNTWGEALGGRIGIGWFLLPFWLIGIVMAVGGAFLCTTVLPLGIGLIAVAVVYLITLGLVNSALETILQSGLYLYATEGQVPNGMDRSVLQQGFTAKT